jgi:tetratricopeptide (TPR) repeat protein
MNLEKLKDTARKLEQKEDWRKAIEVYLKAIQQAESGAETSPDLSLYNRVGDLYLKINDTTEAVRSYERAVDLYADQGFFNNAIALCGKILRVNPGRTQTYLKLCQLHARKNVVSEAKRNLIEFLERMNALGQLDQAFQAVKLFADQFSGSQEIRSMLVDLLRATSRGDEAREQLEKMAHDLEAAGDKTGARKTRERLHGIEPDHSSASANPAGSAPPRRGDLVFLDTGVDVPTTPSRAAPPPFSRPAKESPRVSPAPSPKPEPLLPENLLPNDDLVTGSNLSPDLIIDPMLSEDSSGAGAESLLGIERLGDSLDTTPDSLLGADSLTVMPDLTAPLDIQRQESSSLDFEPMRLEGMEGTSLSGFSADPQPSPLDFPDDLIVSLPDSETPFNVSPGLQDPFAPDPNLKTPSFSGDVPLIRAREPSGDSLADLENRVLDDPENPDIHLELAEQLLAMGQTHRVAEEFELALAGYEDRQDWGRASQMADRLVELSPDSIGHHQKRVELAYRMGDRAPLLEAYLGLGHALAKSGAIDKASAVYGRVIEHDPGNTQAAAALARLGPAEPAPAPTKPKATATPTSTKAPPPAKAPPPPPQAKPKAPAPTPPPTQRATSAPPPRPAPATAAPASARRKAEPDSEEGFVDLGSMVRDDHNKRDTRMRVNRRDPTGQDEQREFHEILEQFKRGIDENLESDDYQSHYDLGVAFKEMGLLDEAIGEFQKALRASEGRLRTSEALGMAFFEKGQYAVCESVLRRAVEGLDGSDEAKIGLLYWMGRAAEAQGKKADAMASYERAMAVDIRFLDLSQRMHRLTAGRK